VIEPAVDEGDLDVTTLVAQRLLCRRHVLAVLLAARVGVMSGGDKADGVAHSIRMHRLQRVGQVWMPVTHADIDRQRMADGGEPRPQSVRLPLRQLRDG
jgi:hypothetical protein